MSETGERCVVCLDESDSFPADGLCVRCWRTLSVSEKYAAMKMEEIASIMGEIHTTMREMFQEFGDQLASIRSNTR